MRLKDTSSFIMNTTLRPSTSGDGDVQDKADALPNVADSPDLLGILAPLLYCVICLLTIITILLLALLLKKSFKKCKGSMSFSNIEGGTFRMSDLGCNADHENPNTDTVSHSNEVQTYNACNDDSSSTSSESMCHSYGDKNNDNNQQYISLQTTILQSVDYGNILKGKSTSANDCEKKMGKKNRDYVNIEEEQNMRLTKGRRSKTERHQGEPDESQTSSESSSDESDDNSVNYSTVVFKAATNEVQREQ